MDAFEVKMKRVKETKNTVRFEEDSGDEPMKIGTLYVQKWAAKDVQSIKVTVEEEK